MDHLIRSVARSTNQFIVKVKRDAMPSRVATLELRSSVSSDSADHAMSSFAKILGPALCKEEFLLLYGHLILFAPQYSHYPFV
jgi:hypothetical protein